MDTAGWIAAAGAALIVLAYHLAFTIFGRLNFDEAYNLQIPLNLYLNGHYQSWYDTPLLFPAQITTGPTVLLPVAGLFAVSGPSYHAARAVMTLFMIGYLWQAYVLCRRLTRRAANWVFAAACVLFVFVPLAPWLSSIVLGEVPGLFLLLLAVNLMTGALAGRRLLAFAAGAALGLAVICKLVLLLCAAGVFLALPLCSELRGRRMMAVSRGAVCLGGFVLPIAVWELAQFVVLGWSGYRAHFSHFLWVVSFGGSGLTRQGGLRAAPSIVRHVEVLARDLGEPVWAALLGLALAGAVILWVLGRPPRPFALLSLVLGALTYWTWWLRLSTWLMVRHLTIGYVVYALVLPIVGATVVGDARLRTGVRAVLLALLAGAATLTLAPWRSLPAPWTHRNEILDQEATAGWVRFIRARDPHNVFWGYGWQQAPEISFLAEVPFRDITRHTPRPGEHNFLVLTGLYSGNVGHLDYAKRHCQLVIAQGAGVQLCLLQPDAPQARDRTPHP